MESSNSLAPVAASGSLGALLVALSQQVLKPAPLDFSCPALDTFPALHFWGLQLDLISLILGITIGLILYPLLELFFLWRAYVRACIKPDSLYKIKILE